MADDYTAVPDGLLLVATIIFWAYALNWLAFHVPRLRKLIHPQPLPLIRDGEVLEQNLRKELVARDELLSQLRLQGVEDPSEVKSALMESDGRISVIKKNGGETNSPPERAT
jgi:uncharacterized membrane protein YcaP (DUF421 family)